MSENVLKRLGSALTDMGSEFAEVEDSVKAVLRIACDDGINGMISLLREYLLEADKIAQDEL